MDYRGVHIYLERLGAHVPGTLSNRDWVDYRFGSVILRLYADGSRLEVELEKKPKSNKAISLKTVRDELELGVNLLTWTGQQNVQTQALGNFSDALIKSLEDYVTNGPIAFSPQQQSAPMPGQAVPFLQR